MKRTWKGVREEAIKERSNSGIYVHPDGQTVDSRDGSGRIQTFRIDQLASVAITAAHEAEEMLRDWLPVGCEDLYDNFSHRQLKDSLVDPRSIFLQPQNADLIEPIRLRVQEQLLNPKESRHTIVKANGKVDMERVRLYARVENDILNRIATHFCVTCGIAPREFQLKTLLYDSILQGGLSTYRNLFILDECLSIGHPDAKRMTKVELADCLWGLTQIISRPLSFLLAIMRPTLTHLLALVGLDTSLRDHRIFVRTCPVKQRLADTYVMTGCDVNAGMQRLSQGIPLRLTCNFLRRLFTTLFEQHHSIELTGEEGKDQTTGVTEQGQHGPLVKKTHYIKSHNVPPILRMPLDKARQHLRVSRLAQAILGMNQHAEGLDEEILHSSPIYQWRKNERRALAEARRLVVTHYRLGGQGDEDQIKLAVKDVFERCPFIYGVSFILLSRMGSKLTYHQNRTSAKIVMTMRCEYFIIMV
jgi:hypothetical protein